MASRLPHPVPSHVGHGGGEAWQGMATAQSVVGLTLAQAGMNAALHRVSCWPTKGTGAQWSVAAGRGTRRWPSTAVQGSLAGLSGRLSARAPTPTPGRRRALVTTTPPLTGRRTPRCHCRCIQLRCHPTFESSRPASQWCPPARCVSTSPPSWSQKPGPLRRLCQQQQPQVRRLRGRAGVNPWGKHFTSSKVHNRWPRGTRSASPPASPPAPICPSKGLVHACSFRLPPLTATQTQRRQWCCSPDWPFFSFAQDSSPSVIWEGADAASRLQLAAGRNDRPTTKGASRPGAPLGARAKLVQPR